MPLLRSLLFLAFTSLALALTPTERVATLIDPVKLSTLAQRGGNPRVQKYVAQLEEARVAGWDAARVAAEAVALTGMRGEAARLTVAAMLRNLSIAERLGCLTPEGLHDMRRGQSPTITRGPYAGDQLSVDHVIPFSVAPALDKVIANLELMPLRLNIGSRAAAVAARQIMRMHDPKGDMSVRREGVNMDTMGERQRDLLQKLRAAGLAH